MANVICSRLRIIQSEMEESGLDDSVWLADYAYDKAHDLVDELEGLSDEF